MTIQEIASRLIELCRAGDFETAYTELYSDDIKSYEPEGWGERETVGIAAKREKSKAWQESIAEVHGSTMSDPIFATDSFACSSSFDVTMKDGTRMNMVELNVYTVKDGKIVREEFFA